MAGRFINPEPGPDPLNRPLILDSGAPDVFNNYVEAFPPGLRFGPGGVFSIGTGDSVTFAIAVWQPWPLTGNPGDPVPEGQYVIHNAAFSAIAYSTFNPFVQHPVDLSDAGDFTWTVFSDPNGPTPIPLPAGLTLLGALTLRRRAGAVA